MELELQYPTQTLVLAPFVHPTIRPSDLRNKVSLCHRIISGHSIIPPSSSPPILLLTYATTITCLRFIPRLEPLFTYLPFLLVLFLCGTLSPHLSFVFLILYHSRMLYPVFLFFLLLLLLFLLINYFLLFLLVPLPCTLPCLLLFFSFFIFFSFDRIAFVLASG